MQKKIAFLHFLPIFCETPHTLLPHQLTTNKTKTINYYYHEKFKNSNHNYFIS